MNKRIFAALAAVGLVWGARATRAPDYADPTGRDWAYNHDIAERRFSETQAKDLDVDLFYIYPTLAWTNTATTVNGFVDINDPRMRGNEAQRTGGVWSTFNEQARVFADDTRVYVPFYRQGTIEYCLSAIGKDPTKTCQECVACMYKGIAFADVINALECYFTKHNPGGTRPYILAGHSQGAILLRLVMEHYFTREENKPKLKNLVACYALGFGVSSDWMDKVTAETKSDQGLVDGVRIATDATSTGVYITWNTVGPDGVKYPNMLVPPKAISVNPLTWTTNAIMADASFNLGAWTTNRVSTVKPGLYDAVVDTAHGVVVTTGLPSQYIPVKLGFGDKSLHTWDYKAWWENLRANARERIFTAKKKGK